MKKYICIKDYFNTLGVQRSYRYNIYNIENDIKYGKKRSFIYLGESKYIIRDETIDEYFIELNKYRKLKIDRLK